MKNAKQSAGIRFLPEIKIAETETIHFQATWLAEALILFLGIAGTFFAVVTAFHLAVEPVSIFLLCGICALGFTGLYHVPKLQKWLPWVGMVLFAVFAYFYRKDYLEGLIQFKTAVMECRDMEVLGELETAGEFSVINRYTSLWFHSIIIFISMLAGLCVVQQPCFWLYALLLTPFVEAGFLLGLSSSLWAVAAVVISFLCVFCLSTLYRRNKGKKKAKRRPQTTMMTMLSERGYRAILIPICAAMILLVLGSLSLSRYLMKAVHYERPQLLDDIRDKFQDGTLRDLVFTSGGGVAGGKLDLGNIVYRNEPALRVTMPDFGETVYLKGYVGSRYTGKSWASLSKEEGEEYDARFSEYEKRGITPVLDLDLTNRKKRTVEIERLNASPKFAYLPPSFFPNTQMKLLHGDYAEPLTKSMRILSANVSTVKVQDKNFYEFYSENEPDFLQMLETYGDYVKELYTKLPDDIIKNQEILDLLTRVATSSTSDIAVAVREFMWDHATYTLTPGSLPRGEDFIDYFLFQNKRGYCSHFAATGAVLLRLAGVPTRYVEGYLVTQKDFEKGTLQKKLTTETEYSLGALTSTITTEEDARTFEILDSNAHAWVEYYQNGRWVLMDMTPGYGGTTTVVPDPNRENAVPDAAPDNTADTTPVQTVTPPENEPNYDTFDQYGGYTTEQKAQAAKESRQLFLQLLSGISIMLLLILFVLLIRQRRSGYLRNQSFGLADRSQAVLSIYAYLCQLLRSSGDEISPTLCLWEAERLESKLGFFHGGQFVRAVEIINKAQFSEKPVTEKELETVLDTVQFYAQQLYQGKTRMKRIWMKYGRNLY